MINRTVLSRLFVVFSLCLFLQPVSAQDTLYVWARSGLNLRKTPDFKGEKIATLPYGTLVHFVQHAQVIKQWSELAGDYEEPVVVQLPVLKNNKGNATYSIQGSWIKVTTGDKEGYLFDAYLSSMIPNQGNLTASADESVDHDLQNLQTYLTRRIGLAHQTSELTVFKNGASIHQGGRVWVFPEYNEHDGYLLINYFFNLENSVAKGKKGESPFLKYDREDDEHSLEFEYEIRGQAGYWLLFDFWQGILRIMLDEDSRC